jgi:hypothetical protein
MSVSQCWLRHQSCRMCSDSAFLQDVEWQCIPAGWGVTVHSCRMGSDSAFLQDVEWQCIPEGCGVTVHSCRMGSDSAFLQDVEWQYIPAGCGVTVLPQKGNELHKLEVNNSDLLGSEVTTKTQQTIVVPCATVWEMLEQLLSSGAPKGGLGGSTTPNSEVLPKLRPTFQFREIYIRNNLIIIWFSFICKLCETPDWGATAPRSPFSMPSVLNWICWTPPEKISWVCRWLQHPDFIDKNWSL